MSKLILLSVLLLASCADTEEVTVTIIRVTPFDCGDRFMCGCLRGENIDTTIKGSNGKIDHLCGYFGEVGDTFTGRWISNHPLNENGFRQ